MTAKEMVLAYYGYGKDYDPNNLSGDLREQLIATINLMHEWENQQLKKIKADAADCEAKNTLQEKEIDRLKVELYNLSNHNAAIIKDLSDQRDQLRAKDEEIDALKTNGPSDYSDLYKELAILEKQRNEKYQKLLNDMEAMATQARDIMNDKDKEISKQNDLIVSLEAQINQDEYVKNDLRNNLMDFKEECNRLEGVVRHWQMKYYDDIAKVEGFDLPKIDNL